MERQGLPPNGSPQPVAIGIDFGTSKCCVAAVRDGRAHVLENEFGQRTTPSWVAFNSQQRLVGGAALDQAVLNCANTVSAVKRTLGRTYDDVKRIPSSCGIKKCSDGTKFEYCISYRRRDKFLSPEQIAAMMLTKMKDIAETSLGRPVGKAVISVPACYDNAQRTAIINAAKVAGLEVLQLINETTAAGIAFEDNRSLKTPVTIAVVDFGAGKLDISVMKVEGKSIKVIGASGSPFLGGSTVDEVLVGHCAKFIQQKFGNKVKINDKVGVKLRLACEKAKKTLSLLPEAQVCIESIVEDSDVSIPVSRQDIYELFDGEIRKTINANFRHIFKKNSMDKHNIDKIVLVGGSTRIPAVRSILEEYFGSHKLDQTVNQDEAVAQGAALRAAALSGAAAGIEVSDVSSFDICCSKHNVCSADILINKFKPLPCIGSFQVNHIRGTKLLYFERTYSFTGSCCDVLIGLLELNKSLSSKNTRVTGYLDLHLDESGIFDIYVRLQDDQSTFRYKPNDFQSRNVNRWMEEEKQFRSDTIDELKRVDAEVELESLCFDVQNALSKLESIEDISYRELESFRQAISNATKWMMNDIAAAQLSEISGKISKLLNVKTEVDRKLDTAQKKEAAKKEAKAKLKEQILAFKSLLSEVKFALQDSDLVMDFYPHMLQQSKDKMSSFMTWEEDIESASMTEVSQKLEELTRVKIELERLKADAAREKTRREAKIAARKLEEKELLKTQISEYESLLSEVKRVLHDTIFVTYSDQQIFKACELKLNSLLAWKKDCDTASITQVSQKLAELTQLRSKVDQMKTDALEEAQEKEALEKRKEMELRKERICTFKYLISEVKETLNDLYPVRSSYSSKFWSCDASLHLLEGGKAIIETGSVTLVSKKLGELMQLKREVDQLKTDVERRKRREINEVPDAMLAQNFFEQQTGLHNSSNSSPANEQTNWNVALSSNYVTNERIKRELSLISFNSSSGSVESPLISSASNHDHTEKGRSQSVARPAEEGQRHSRNGPRSPSVDVANGRRSRVQSGQSLKQFQSSENLKNGHSSLTRSRQNSVDDLTKRRSICLSRKVLVDQNGEPCSSSRQRQPSGSEDIGQQSRTSLNYEVIVGERRRSQERSSRSRQPSEHERVEHRSRTPHNSGVKEGERKVSNRECSSFRSRYESAASKERRLPGLSSSLKDEHHHQPKTSCEGTANGGFHLHQRGSSDKCTEQPASARRTGSPLVQMRKSAVVKSVTLPNKHSPRLGLAPSKDFDSTFTCESDETQAETSARTKTVVASSEYSYNFRRRTSSGDDVKEYCEKEEKLVRKFSDAGILFPILEIMENTSRNIADCEKCLGFKFTCRLHHDESFEKFGKFLNSLAQISIAQKLGERKNRLQSENSVEFVENVLSTDKSSASNVNHFKERKSSNDVANSYAEFSDIVPYQDNDIPDGGATVMPSRPEGSTKPVIYYSVYLTQPRAATDVRENCGSGPSQWHLSGNKVQSLKEKFECSSSV